MKTISVLVCSLILCSQAIAFYQIDYPGALLDKPVKVESRLKDSGKLVNSEVYETVMSGKNLVTSISGTSTDDKGNTYKTQSYVYYTLKNNKLSSLAQTTVMTREGKPFASTQINFDWSKMKAYFSAKNLVTGQTGSKTINLTPKTMLTQSTSFFFPMLIAKNDPQENFSLIIPTGDLYGMKASVNLTPASVNGKQCLSVKMNADAGLLSGILPDMLFYYEQDGTHSFVQYVGPNQGPFSPVVIQKVVD